MEADPGVHPGTGHRLLNPELPNQTMSRLKPFFPLFIFIFPALFSQAQKKNSNKVIHIRHTGSAPVIDGRIGNGEWSEAEYVTNFKMVLPMDTSVAKARTEVRMTYDETNLYLVAICSKPVQGPYRVESLRRDFSFLKNDNFIVFIDPFDDQVNGFAFGSNAAGAQWDGLMYDGGKVDLSWDNKWVSATSNTEREWIVEMAIPLKTLRYKQSMRPWGINFSRLDLKTAEKSSWAGMPRQFPTASLAYSGLLVWDKNPPAPGANVSVIPYVSGSIGRDQEHAGSTKLTGKAGVDAKVALSSSLNLDLTVNPDFSQVEVDQQVTNLDRFELFFPERRQFFLENADIFGNFGYQNIRPFFSRRIGLGVPIIAGARLSGKIDRDWRIGVMDMQTARQDEIGLPAQNFGVFSLQRRVFKRSSIGMIMVNKESLNYIPGSMPDKPVYSQYNRNIGLEYNLASANNIWTGGATVLKSFTPGKNGHDLSLSGNLQYSSRVWTINWQQEYVGRNFVAETGYVPRVGYHKFNPTVARNFFPRSGPILSHNLMVNSTYFFNEAMHMTDNETNLAWTITFRKQPVLTTWIAHDFVELLQPFDPTNSGKDTLARGSLHRWNAFGTSFTSSPGKLFTYSFNMRYGGYYSDGTRLNLAAELGYRFQPFANLYMAINYNDIQLPKPWGKNDFWLIGPRIDLTLTNKIFFTTYIQYNDQLKNINLNTRFQWRYRPASDLYIVYTDNYLPAPFSVKNRAIVLKLNYWWNL